MIYKLHKRITGRKYFNPQTSKNCSRLSRVYAYVGSLQLLCNTFFVKFVLSKKIIIFRIRETLSLTAVIECRLATGCKGLNLPFC